MTTAKKAFKSHRDDDPLSSLPDKSVQERRRLRNIESARKSRARLRSETSWMAVQMSEIEDKIERLESVVTSLSSELSGKTSKEAKKIQKRSSESSSLSSSSSSLPDGRVNKILGEPF